MENYVYFALGIVLGLLIAVYYYMSREERIEATIKLQQKIYSTEILDNTMKTVVDRIEEKIVEVKRDLTEEEKNDIIVQCYKEKYNL